MVMGRRWDTPMGKLHRTHALLNRVFRTLELFYANGSVSKRPYPNNKAFRMVTMPAQLLIFQLFLDKPGIYLHAIQKELQTVLLLEVHVRPSTICSRFLQKSGFTRQRLYTTALQRDEFLRQQYILDLSVYSLEIFVFIDETGTDRRNR